MGSARRVIHAAKSVPGHPHRHGVPTKQLAHALPEYRDGNLSVRHCTVAGVLGRIIVTELAIDRNFKSVPPQHHIKRHRLDMLEDVV
jgi:hypothetical protein